MKGTWPAVVFFSLAALGPVVVRDPFLLDGLILILLWGATASAWNVAGGYAGQVSLGHAAFFGLGAYSAALLGTRWGLSPWIGLAEGPLRELAAATGGGFYREEDLHRLAASVVPKSVAFTHRQEVLLWNPLALVLFVVLVTAEWVLRKLANLS